MCTIKTGHMEYNGKLENNEIIFNLQRKMAITKDNLGRYGIRSSSSGIEEWEE